MKQVPCLPRWAFDALRTHVREQQKEIARLKTIVTSLQRDRDTQGFDLGKLQIEVNDSIKSRRQMMEEMVDPFGLSPEPKPYNIGTCKRCNKPIHQKMEGISWVHDATNNVYCEWVKATPR